MVLCCLRGCILSLNDGTADSMCWHNTERTDVRIYDVHSQQHLSKAATPLRLSRAMARSAMWYGQRRHDDRKKTEQAMWKVVAFAGPGAGAEIQHPETKLRCWQQHGVYFQPALSTREYSMT